jgi:uncharacterized protein YqgC (DUF456 family)
MTPSHLAAVATNPSLVALSVEVLVSGGFAIFALLCVGLVVVGLPGAWIMIAGAIAIDLLDSLWLPAGAPLTFHPLTIAAAALVAGIGELLEFLLSAAGAKRFGASGRGMIGSVVGGVLGALGGTVILPIAGTIMGALIGTATGAILGELSHGNRTLRDTARPAAGAVVGRLLGTLAKLPCAALVAVILAVAVFVR